ncbi:MAG: hypothetical protein J2P35_20805 [Actinobacteria bacterium]|nr:hypothetical protein [Actinomycetota bacterium]MBO0787795.1 hypothetical protein [Actinomycetota bacterium]
MRPALKAGLLPVWRDRDTLQIGIDPRRAIALTGMAGAAGLLGLLDGSRDRAQLAEAARELGIQVPAVDRVLALLAAGEALHDLPAGTRDGVPPARRRRLAAELATAALAHGDGDGGARTLARRQAAWVQVRGTGRAGLCLASLLAAAGIGRVTTTGLVSARGRACPRRSGPRGQPAGPGTRPDLAVLAGPQQPEAAAGLMRDAVPHLAASAAEAIGTVGPLVLPGRSACLRCLDAARAERDPAWPLILAQQAGRQPDTPACDVTLATAVAAQAAGQALAFIDRGEAASAVINGTLELFLPDWQWQRRTWRPHPRCGCGRPGSS